MAEVEDEREELFDYIETLGNFGAFISSEDRVFYLAQSYNTVERMLLKTEGSTKSTQVLCHCQDQLWLIELQLSFEPQEDGSMKPYCGGHVVKLVHNLVNSKGLH